jgi:hypothetical protein
MSVIKSDHCWVGHSYWVGQSDFDVQWLAIRDQIRAAKQEAYEEAAKICGLRASKKNEDDESYNEPALCAALIREAKDKL